MAGLLRREQVLLQVWLLLAFSLLVLGQDISPTNDSSATDGRTQFTMDTSLNSMAVRLPIEPLTNQAGLSGDNSKLMQINPTGSLLLTTADNLDDVRNGSIPFLSCEPSDYSGPLGPSKAIQLAANAQPAAIVLYTTYATSCTFQNSDNFGFPLIYTMLDANSSQSVLSGLNARGPQNPQTKIHLNESTVNGTTSNNNDNMLGKSPTTAVAMIILYSITGIITALFLIIIIVGAIRAHRHPERYGPRHVIGRPRQSRAKGIARAMLETLPIVKFGDKEDEKPANVTRDVELAPTNGHQQEHGATESRQEEGTVPSDPSPEDQGQVHPDPTISGVAEQSKEQTTVGKESSSPVEDGLACSVCTDDFIKGQDVRMLPCKHKFHPECIDPWLLNVSGTCPLCRIDLQPKNNTNEGEELPEPTLEVRATEQEAVAEGSNAEASRRNRRSRILSTLNIGRMRHATPQERIDALRTLRTEGMTAVNRPDGADRTNHRFSRRLSRALTTRPASRPTSSAPSRPVSEVPPPQDDPHSNALTTITSSNEPAISPLDEDRSLSQTIEGSNHRQ